MANRYFCVHSHFYQPPRENPWLKFIEVQKSAFPFHNWNERITAECYYPNAFSKIYEHNKVIKVLNNYAYMNFNFGPTLLNWLEKNNDVVYEKILEADRISLKLFNGHGGAIAQVYNHIIMPLAKTRDKIIQIEWGIKDFEYRFKRKPKGMWLAETAVDYETLYILADYGIKFTILSPYQALSVFENNRWIDKQGGAIDVTYPYKIKLRNNKEITVIFYEGNLSKAVAFENLLADGNNFMNVIESKYYHSHHNQIITLATDGETFGHHKKFGELGIAYIFEALEKTKNIKVCNISYYLAHTRDYKEAKILENTAWSCAHGVGRWQTDCGCKIDTYRNWHQKWRAPLREALNNLKDKLDALYNKEMSKYIDSAKTEEILKNYIHLLNKKNTTESAIKKFLDGYTNNFDCSNRILLLLEMQKYAQFMFTSCGWFFDDISGLEATQILKYAYYAIELAKLYGADFEMEFIEQLKKAPSNISELNNGAAVFEKYVKPARYGRKIIAAIAAAYNLYKIEKNKKFELFGYSVKIIDIHKTVKSPKIDYVIALKSSLDCRVFYYFVSISKNIKFSEIYSVSSLDVNLLDLKKLADNNNFEFEAQYKFSDFPNDVRIRLLKKNVVVQLSKNLKFFEKFYEEIDYYKKAIENPDIYLPPVVKSIMQEVIYTKLKKCVLDNDVNNLNELIDAAVIWNVRFIDNIIHKNADKNLLMMLNELLTSIKFQSFDEKLYDKFIQTFRIYKQIELNTNISELQAKFYEFYSDYLPNKGQYSHSVNSMIDNLSRNIMIR